MGIDQILDMGRTTVNLIGNCIATVLIAKWENEFNYTKHEEFDKQFIKQKNKRFPQYKNTLIMPIEIEEHSVIGSNISNNDKNI